MAGPLITNPYLKSYDELQRSIKRMQSHLDINGYLLTQEAKNDLIEMIEYMELALKRIPQEFRKTKHQYSQKD